MDKSNKPHVVVSRCLGFSNCRYDGQGSTDLFVNKLKDYVQYTTVCPEVDMGLTVPRDTIRLVCENDEMILFQPATGNVFTNEMIDFSNQFLSSLKDVDGRACSISIE